MNKGKSTVNQKCSILFLYFQLEFYATRLVSSDSWVHEHPYLAESLEPKVAHRRTPLPLNAPNTDPTTCMPAPKADLLRLQLTAANPMSQMYMAGFLFQKYGTQPTFFQGHQCL